MTPNTCNAAMLQHFQSLSSHWWDEKGPFRALHALTPLRMAFIKEKIGIHFRRLETSSNSLKKLRILDVGCGGGLLCEPLARLGAEVTGIDPIEDNIAAAKAHAKEMNLSITYLPYAVEDLPQSVPLFDVVVASEIIEHVVNPDVFLKACATHLSDQGGMVVTTFNKTLKSYLFGIIAAEYILNWAPKGTHSWKQFMTPQDLAQKLSDLGFVNQEVTGLSFSPLTRSWRFCPSMDVNYFLWAGRKVLKK